MVDALIGADLSLGLKIGSIRRDLDSHNLHRVFCQLATEEQMPLWSQAKANLVLSDPLARPHQHCYRSSLPDRELALDGACLHFSQRGCLLPWIPQIKDDLFLLLLIWEEGDHARGAQVLRNHQRSQSPHDYQLIDEAL